MFVSQFFQLLFIIQLNQISYKLYKFQICQILYTVSKKKICYNYACYNYCIILIKVVILHALHFLFTLIAHNTVYTHLISLFDILEFTLPLFVP